MAETDDIILRLKLQDALRVAAQLRATAREIENLGKSTERTTTQTDRGASSWERYGGVATSAAAGAAVGIGFLAAKVFQTGLSFDVMKQNAQVTFGVLLNSTAKANVLTKQLFDLAQKSSFFRYQDVLQGAQSLLTFGFAARDIIPDLKSLANVASLHPERGSQGIQDLAIILGQIRQSGRLLGQDARQLEQLGLNPYVAIAQRLHETPGLVMQQAQQGLISSKVAIESIFAYANTRFGGLADKLSKTIGGKFSNVQDLLSAAAGAVVAPFLPQISVGADRLITWLQRPSTQREIHQIGVEFARTAASVGPLIIGGTKLAATMLAVVGLPILRGLQALSPEFRVLGNLMGLAADHSTALTIALGALTGPLWLTYESTRLINGSLSKLQETWDWLSKHASLDLAIHYSGPGSRELGWASSILGGAKGLGRGALGAVPGVGVALQNIFPRQAAGGKTTRAGWSWVGEEGPELRWMNQGATVVPLDKASGGGDMGELVGAIRDLARRPVVAMVDGRVLFEVWGDELDRKFSNR